VGDPTAVTDPLGKTVTTAFDARDRATLLTDPLGHTEATVPFAELMAALWLESGAGIHPCRRCQGVP